MPVLFMLLVWMLVACSAPLLPTTPDNILRLDIDLEQPLTVQAIRHGFINADLTNDYFEVALSSCVITPDNPGTPQNEFLNSLNQIQPAAIFDGQAFSGSPKPCTRKALASFPLTKQSVTFRRLLPSTFYLVGLRVFQVPDPARPPLTAINRTRGGTVTTGNWNGSAYTSLLYIQTDAAGNLQIRDLNGVNTYQSLPLTIPQVDTIGASLDGSLDVAVLSTNLDFSSLPANQTTTIQGLNQTSVRIGDRVSLRGFGFHQVRTVLFAGSTGVRVPARFETINNTVLETEVPAGAVTGTLELRDGLGNSLGFSASLTVSNRVWFVDPLNLGGAEDGTDWQNASDWQTALDQAQPGDEIWMAQGTYYPQNNAPYTILPDVPIYGGFQGGDPRNPAFERYRDERRPAQHPTIVSGDLNGNDGQLPSQNPLHPTRLDNDSYLIRIRNAGVYLIEGLQLTNACLDDITGQGIPFDDQASTELTLRDVIFRDNLGAAMGALSSVAGTLKLERVLFERNRGFLNGGAIYFEPLEPTAQLVIYQSGFYQNRSDYLGGAVYFTNDNVSDAQVSIENTVFMDNLASKSGGAIFAEDNTGDALIDIRHSVFYKNQASNKGAALYVDFRRGQIANSIFWDNTLGGNNDESYLLANPFDVLSNIVQANDADLNQNDNISQDPLFHTHATVNLHGPDGLLGTLDDSLHLSVGSPALNSGLNDPSYTSATDLPGRPRPAGGTVDRGAYEWEP